MSDVLQVDVRSCWCWWRGHIYVQELKLIRVCGRKNECEGLNLSTLLLLLWWAGEQPSGNCDASFIHLHQQQQPPLALATTSWSPEFQFHCMSCCFWFPWTCGYSTTRRPQWTSRTHWCNHGPPWLVQTWHEIWWSRSLTYSLIKTLWERPCSFLPYVLLTNEALSLWAGLGRLRIPTTRPQTSRRKWMNGWKDG